VKHMPIDKEIENMEVKGKSFIFFLSNTEHNQTQNITGVVKAYPSQSGLLKALVEVSIRDVVHIRRIALSVAEDPFGNLILALRQVLITQRS